MDFKSLANNPSCRRMKRYGSDNGPIRCHAHGNHCARLYDYRTWKYVCAVCIREAGRSEELLIPVEYLNP